MASPDFLKPFTMTGQKNEAELLRQAQNLCSAREYCVSEIRGKLQKWGCNDEKVSGRIISKLIEERFLDEARYCRAFALDHFRYQKWGRIKISAAMKMKHLPSEYISAGLAAIDEDEYIETLKVIITSFRKSVRAKNRYDLRNRLMRHALSKGYESSLIFQALDTLTEG